MDSREEPLRELKRSVRMQQAWADGADSFIAVERRCQQRDRFYADPRIGVQEEDVRRGAAVGSDIASPREAAVRGQSDRSDREIRDRVETAIRRVVVDDDHVGVSREGEGLDGAAEMLSAVIGDYDGVDP